MYYVTLLHELDQITLVHVPKAKVFFSSEKEVKEQESPAQAEFKESYSPWKNQVFPICFSWAFSSLATAQIKFRVSRAPLQGLASFLLGGQPELHPLLSKRSIWLKKEPTNQKQWSSYIVAFKNQFTKEQVGDDSIFGEKNSNNNS